MSNKKKLKDLSHGQNLTQFYFNVLKKFKDQIEHKKTRILNSIIIFNIVWLKYFLNLKQKKMLQKLFFFHQKISWIKPKNHLLNSFDLKQAFFLKFSCHLLLKLVELFLKELFYFFFKVDFICSILVLIFFFLYFEFIKINSSSIFM